MMDLEQIVTNNQNVIIGGGFTILGVIIGWLLNLCQSYFTNKRADKVHLRDKREEIYVQALFCCLSISMDMEYITTGTPSNSVIKLANDIAPKMKIYAKSKLWQQYSAIQRCLQNCAIDDNTCKNIESLTTAIRKELGIKD